METVGGRSVVSLETARMHRAPSVHGWKTQTSARAQSVLKERQPGSTDGVDAAGRKTDFATP